MSNYSLSRKALLPIALEEAWTFFTQPENLKKITPPKMGFDITGRSADGPVYPGMIITYKVSPLLGIKMNWMTEITHVRENQFFVDEQRLGPYKIWHHEHHFEQTNDGVLMTDIVHYATPWYVPDFIVHPLIIKPQLNEIFDYRTQVLEKLFNAKSDSLV